MNRHIDNIKRMAAQAASSLSGGRADNRCPFCETSLEGELYNDFADSGEKLEFFVTCPGCLHTSEVSAEAIPTYRIRPTRHDLDCLLERLGDVQ